MKCRFTYIILILIGGLTSAYSQEENDFVSSPGSIDNIISVPNDIPPIQDIKAFRERSIGVYFLPIALNFESITFSGVNESTFNNPNGDFVLEGSDAVSFNSGYGLAVNIDFNNSGFGFGALGYFAFIPGESLDGFDGFVGLKYDLPLGDRVSTNFEISPLLGVGSIGFRTVDEELFTGSSLYWSGGVRVTWRMANRWFLGIDAQNAPVFFNRAGLLGVEDTQNFEGDNLETNDVDIEYNFIFQFNASLRFNIF